MEHWEREALYRLPTFLREWLGVPVTVSEGTDPAHRYDLLVKAAHYTLLVEVKGTDNIASLAAAVQRMAAAELKGERTISLLVVPYMGPKAREWAHAHGISWADLSGNAIIRAPGLHIHVSGHENQYTTAGRPSNPFSPRFSRVSRVLLVDPNVWWRQRDLAAETGLPDGTVSKVVQRLTALELLERDDAGALRPAAPSRLLDAWAQHYRFEDHDIRRFHVVGRSGADVLQRLADRLSATPLTWAATGLSAAWLYTRFADFRLTTLYVDRFPPDPEALGLRPVERGENVWLVGPRDEGVFYGRAERAAWCVHPVQVYLDLAGHPERSAEAAANIRTGWLKWRDA